MSRGPAAGVGAPSGSGDTPSGYRNGDARTRGPRAWGQTCSTRMVGDTESRMSALTLRCTLVGPGRQPTTVPQGAKDAGAGAWPVAARPTRNPPLSTTGAGKVTKIY